MHAAETIAPLLSVIRDNDKSFSLNLIITQSCISPLGTLLHLINGLARSEMWCFEQRLIMNSTLFSLDKLVTPPSLFMKLSPDRHCSPLIDCQRFCARVAPCDIFVSLKQGSYIKRSVWNAQASLDPCLALAAARDPGSFGGPSQAVSPR